MGATVGSGLEALVYQISLGLLYPTLALLALALFHLMWCAGEVAEQWWGLRRRSAATVRRLRDLRPDDTPAGLTAVADDPRQPAPVRAFARGVADELRREPAATLGHRVEHLLRETETRLAREVNRLRVLVRVGPCLGLAGTLIPLGPALLALEAGDFAALSAQLVVSFSTTVLGLVVGGGGYVLGTFRAHLADLLTADLELIAGIVTADPGGKP